MADGGGSSQTVVNTPGPTAEETALTKKQVELAEAQLEAIRQQTDLQRVLFSSTKEFSDLQTSILHKLVDEANAPPTERELKAQNLQDELVDKQLEILRRGGAASPEERALITQATEAGIASGGSDIDRSASDALRQLREELAPSLGLNPSDTAIMDRGQLVAREALRQKGQLTSNLRGAAAQAELSYPLARDQLMSGIAGGQQQLAAASEQFQQDLRTQALANRMAVSDALQSRLGLAVQGGLGLATGIPGASAANSGVASLAGLRAATAGRNVNTSQGFGAAQFGQLMGGVGGLALGVAALNCSRDLKENGRPADPEAVLAALAKMPLETWNYVGDSVRHIGTYAEDFKKLFGVGDGKTIAIVDIMGVLLGAAKAMAMRAVPA